MYGFKRFECGGHAVPPGVGIRQDDENASHIQGRHKKVRMNNHAKSEPAPPTPSASAGTMTLRGLRLLCPKCGQGRIFRGWFAMNDRCPACGRLFNRAPGYLLGSIYINYGLTALLVVVMYFALYFSETLQGKPLLAAMTALCVLFPLWFFRYARALWIAFDERWDPWPNEEEQRREANQ